MIKKQHIKYLYLDIVGFTRPERTIDHQAMIFRELNEIIIRAIRNIPFGRRILLPTGDGVCVALMEWEGQAPDVDLALAGDILGRIDEHNGRTGDEPARFSVRAGLNEDEDDIVVDINGHVNFAGRGINYARRIMDLAEGNQILVGANTYNRLRDRPDYRFKKYKCRIKHEETLVVYQCTRIGGSAAPQWLNVAELQFHRVVKVPSYEREYKFMIPGGENDAYLTFGSIRDRIEALAGNFRVAAQPERTSADTYFDDDDFNLHAVGASFRLRKAGGIHRAAVRRRLPSRGPHAGGGRYERIEEETEITPVQARDLRAGRPIGALPYRILPYIAPACGRLTPWITVETRRNALRLQNEAGHAVELCLNETVYGIGGDRHGPHFEIELENLGAPESEVDGLAAALEERLGLIPSGQSRYERGISLMRTAGTAREKKMVIIDTDCGVDDALALILALRAPELDVRAITTVAGQVDVEKVTANVFKVLDALGTPDPPPVSRGAARPLARPLRTSEFIHGEDGLGDAVGPPGHMPVSHSPAWETICALARRFPKQITLVTIGPLTNVALAVRNDPAGLSHLKEIVSMGGVFFDVGNVGPGTEYNISADPEAAFDVVRFCRDSCLKIPVDADGSPVRLPPDPSREDYEAVAGYKDRDPSDPARVPLTFIGLDVTHQVVFRRAILERIVRTHPDNGVLDFIHRISKHYLDYCHRNEWLPGCYIYDPLAVAHVINPSFLEIETHVVHVETGGGTASGMIIPDLRPTRNPAWRNPAEEVIGIARRVEREAFEEFFITRMIGS